LPNRPFQTRTNTNTHTDTNTGVRGNKQTNTQTYRHTYKHTGRQKGLSKQICRAPTFATDCVQLVGKQEEEEEAADGAGIPKGAPHTQHTHVSVPSLRFISPAIYVKLIKMRNQQQKQAQESWIIFWGKLKLGIPFYEIEHLTPQVS